jgi:Spy/CpxP family protein refolding chaperone
MARHFRWVFLLTMLYSAGPAAASLCDHQQRGDDAKKPQQSAGRSEDPPRWKWWLHPDSRKELRLTDQQVKQIDQIFEETIPKQRERWHKIEELDEAVAKMVRENTADVNTVAQLIEKVEKLRAEERTTRAVMIYRMHLLLNPEQRAKVDAMRAKFEEERKKQDEERKRQGRGDKR